MIITSYGIDCAFCQAIYFHHTGALDFLSTSNKHAEVLISVHQPEFLVGLRVNPDVLPQHTVVIDNTKASNYLYENHPTYITGDRISRSHLLYNYLHADMLLYPMVSIADAFVSGYLTEEQDLYYYLYKALGFSGFVSRFVGDPNIKLSKYEQQLALLYRKNVNSIVDNILDIAMERKEELVVCKAGFDLKDTVEGTILHKYREDIALIALWDFSSDGLVYVNLTSKGDLAGKMAEKMGGENYFRSGTVSLNVPKDCYENISSYLTDMLYEVFDEVKNEHWRNLCEAKQKAIAEQYGQDANTIETALSDGF